MKKICQYWKRWYFIVCLFAFIGVLILSNSRKVGDGNYPSGPITLVVHSKPGSGIDMFARVVADIAQRKHKVSFVVENRTGTQGVVAMDYVLERKSDGYTVLGVTKSFLSTLVVQKSKIQLDDFTFVANMIQDPEAVIANRHSKIAAFDALVADARLRPGKQAWIGPGTGGRDHLMALKTWELLGIQAQWIDYKSAPQTALAMLRGEGDVTVGNPGDVDGKSDLTLLAVAHSERLKKFPETPTFRELGYNLHEYMWRGFAVKRGVSETKVQFLENLFKDISSDEEFIKYVSESSSAVDFKGTDAFSKQVSAEIKETQALLTKANLLENYIQKGALPGAWVYSILFLIVLLSLLIGSKIFHARLTGNSLIAGVLIWVCSVFWYQTTLFLVPDHLNITSPSLVPRLWIFLLAAFSVALIVREFKANAQENSRTTVATTDYWEQIKRLIPIVSLTGVYYFTVPFFGFLLATFVFLVAITRLVYSRDLRVGVAFASTFAMGCYLVFDLILSAELPSGIFG
jgi:putative tricarboxylic transport membrane protein